VAGTGVEVAAAMKGCLQGEPLGLAMKGMGLVATENCGPSGNHGLDGCALWRALTVQTCRVEWTVGSPASVHPTWILNLFFQPAALLLHTLPPAPAR